MKKNGFTLVELLAVIAILAIVGMIAYPSVKGVINKARENAYEQQINIIEQAARKWGVEHAEQLSMDQDVIISLQDLVENGYLNRDDINNPKDNTKLTGCVSVVFQSHYNQYDYHYIETDACLSS